MHALDLIVLDIPNEVEACTMQKATWCLVGYSRALGTLRVLHPYIDDDATLWNDFVAR